MNDTQILSAGGAVGTLLGLGISKFFTYLAQGRSENHKLISSILLKLTDTQAELTKQFSTQTEILREQKDMLKDLHDKIDSQGKAIVRLGANGNPGVVQ